MYYGKAEGAFALPLPYGNTMIVSLVFCKACMQQCVVVAEPCSCMVQVAVMGGGN
jgi:hypothetical protein